MLELDRRVSVAAGQVERYVMITASATAANHVRAAVDEDGAVGAA